MTCTERLSKSIVTGRYCRISICVPDIRCIHRHDKALLPQMRGLLW
uniref:Uncharacterized protein n=1 Tax=Arundo donax TaxID=35708 RepID=A0A0A9CWV3_ARUDO